SIYDDPPAPHHDVMAVTGYEEVRARALLTRLLTPSRLRETAQFIGLLAAQQLDPVISAGHFEFIHEYASPLATLVIAELLGVPEADFDHLRARFGLMGG